jgi:NAD(P)-dependent dehydrogenase (short-subunit alcohol dehydrogenase family)
MAIATPPGSGRLAGRRILVTGASRGIGAAVARACAEAGADLALTARSASELSRVAGEAAGHGVKVTAIAADLRDEARCAALIAAAREQIGGLDSAVACQGVNRIAPVGEMPAAEWAEVLTTNLTASFFVARALAPDLRPPGAIVFLSSVSGLPGYRKFPGFAAYCASKRGLLGLAEVLAVETRDAGGRVYSVCPRGVDTAMFRSTFPGATAELSPTEVAERIVDLLDPATAPGSGSVVEL